ncbi:hypothetical protein ACRALDRAFT_207881, partial [Sodiomyces alcalophilus JCM 7366]|uniref:uncharacterized protein n=1 Tax=Sodiomyces alcalophilus JCM 7366 TaxID=591952 RepID=UPI0039B440CB
MVGCYLPTFDRDLLSLVSHVSLLLLIQLEDLEQPDLAITYGPPLATQKRERRQESMRRDVIGAWYVVSHERVWDLDRVVFEYGKLSCL